jgi:allantoinase
MSAVEVAFKGRAVVSGNLEPCVVSVADGVVVAVDPVDSTVDAARLVRLGADEVLLPGLVDTHVHVNEPGRTEWEGFESATRAAAAGGVTTILDMPLNSIPPTVDVASLETKRACAVGRIAVDVGFWGGAVPANLGRLHLLHDEGVFGLKCFLVDSGVPEFPSLDLAELDAAAREVAGFDGLLIVHAEDPGVIADAPDCVSFSHGDFVRSRPHEAEDVAVAHVVDAATRHATRVHIVHLSSADALPQLTRARANGVRITAETCPHYLTLRAEEIADGRTEFKCCPPIRGRANQDRLWAALADGTIDCIVSDHSPSTAELKVGGFADAWGGIASLQIGLPVVWTEARRRGHTLVDVTRWMAQRPAELAGLADRGRIEVGARADLVVFAPDATFVVDPSRLRHRNPVTPYAGRTMSGVVRSTWLAGLPIEAEARGQLLCRGGHPDA